MISLAFSARHDPIPDFTTGIQNMPRTTLAPNTLIALELIKAGWRVEYSEALDCVSWISPRGIGGSAYTSTSLDEPPGVVIMDAIDHEDINP